MMRVTWYIRDKGKRYWRKARPEGERVADEILKVKIEWNPKRGKHDRDHTTGKNSKGSAMAVR
jgi:hypothetical protein